MIFNNNDFTEINLVPLESLRFNFEKIAKKPRKPESSINNIPPHPSIHREYQVCWTNLMWNLRNYVVVTLIDVDKLPLVVQQLRCDCAEITNCLAPNYSNKISMEFFQTLMAMVRAICCDIVRGSQTHSRNQGTDYTAEAIDDFASLLNSMNSKKWQEDLVAYHWLLLRNSLVKQTRARREQCWNLDLDLVNLMRSQFEANIHDDFASVFVKNILPIK
jgi:hypothetical protein